MSANFTDIALMVFVPASPPLTIACVCCLYVCVLEVEAYLTESMSCHYQ